MDLHSHLVGIVEAFKAALDGEASVAVMDGPSYPPPAETLMVAVGVSWTDREPPVTATATDQGFGDAVDQVVTTRCVLSRRESSSLTVAEARGLALGNLLQLQEAIQADQSVGSTCGIAAVSGTTRIWHGRDDQSTWCDIAFEVRSVLYL